MWRRHINERSTSVKENRSFVVSSDVQCVQYGEAISVNDGAQPLEADAWSIEAVRKKCPSYAMTIYTKILCDPLWWQLVSSKYCDGVNV